MKRGLWVALVAFVLDQLSKWGVQYLFEAYRPGKAFGSYFNLVEAWNRGVSFSMFTQEGFVGTLILVVTALVIIGALLYWLKHEKSAWAQVFLGLVIGGALGNVIDRIRYGAVFDFLDFHYMHWHWPAFNLADTFICVGVVFLVFQNIWQSDKFFKKGAKNK